MRDAIPDWEVPESAWSTITGGIELPDPNDVYVLAAAIAGIQADESASQEAAIKPTRFRIRFGAGWSANDGRAAETRGGIDLITPTNFLYGTLDWSRGRRARANELECS